MESAETPDEGGHPPDDEVGLHHSPPDDAFKVIPVWISSDYQERLVDD